MNIFNAPKKLIYDIESWEELQWKKISQEEDLNKILQKGTEKIYSFPTLGKEIYAKLTNPFLKKLETILPEHEWVLKFHEELDTSTEFKILQENIKNLSGFNYIKKKNLAIETTKKFLNQIEKQLPKQNFENPEQLRKEYLKEKTNLNRPKILQEIQNEGKKEVQKQQNYSLNNSINNDLENIIQQTNEHIKNIEKTLNAFNWGQNSGELIYDQSQWNEQLTLANNLKDNYDLNQIIKIAGRLKIGYNLSKKKESVKNFVVNEIELGNNLLKILPQEWNYFLNPKTKNIFYQKYIQKSLLQFTENKKELKLGPLVVCLDLSGSTSSFHLWLKAIGLVLFNIAQKEKRAFSLIIYKNNIVREYHIPNYKKFSLIELTKLFSIRPDGGTNWQLPLDKSLKIIKTSPAFKQADICFITDGECSVDNLWLKNFKLETQKLNINIYGVIVFGESTELKKITNKYIKINHLEVKEINKILQNF